MATLCWRQLQDSLVECGNTPVVALEVAVRLLRENAGELSVLRFTSERPRRVRESRLSWCECEPTPLSGGSGPGSSCGGNPRAATASRESRLSWRRAQALLSFGGMRLKPSTEATLLSATHIAKRDDLPFCSSLGSAQAGPQPWSLLRGPSQSSCLLHRCVLSSPYGDESYSFEARPPARRTRSETSYGRSVAATVQAQSNGIRLRSDASH